MPHKYTRIRTEEQLLRYSDILDRLIHQTKIFPDPELEEEIILLTFLIDMYHEWYYDELLENIHLNESD